MSKKELTLFKI